MASAENTNYNDGNITIENNNDGSGKYHDKSKNLLIENNGKGKATVTYNGKTVEVNAKAIEQAKFFKIENGSGCSGYRGKQSSNNFRFRSSF